VSLPPEILTAIGRAVEAQGGDLDDALDLAAVWERLAADPHGRLERLRFENEKRQERALAEEVEP
jgi:hypothetical protein